MILNISQCLLGFVSSILTCLCVCARARARVSERDSLCVSMAAWLMAAFELWRWGGGHLKPIWHGSSLLEWPAQVTQGSAPLHSHTRAHLFIFTDLLENGSILNIPAVLPSWKSSSCSSSHPPLWLSISQKHMFQYREIKFLATYAFDAKHSISSVFVLLCFLLCPKDFIIKQIIQNEPSAWQGWSVKSS